MFFLPSRCPCRRCSMRPSDQRSSARARCSIADCASSPEFLGCAWWLLRRDRHWGNDGYHRSAGTQIFDAAIRLRAAPGRPVRVDGSHVHERAVADGCVLCATSVLTTFFAGCSRRREVCGAVFAMARLAAIHACMEKTTHETRAPMING